jgi:hypothetical protein
MIEDVLSGRGTHLAIGGLAGPASLKKQTLSLFFKVLRCVG